MTQLADPKAMIVRLDHYMLIIFLYAILFPSSHAADGDVRLAGSNLGYKGRVEVEYQDEWGTVCNRLWGINDAHVICKQLGFEEGATYTSTVVSDNDVTGTAGAIWLYDVECTGSETSISECAGATFDVTNNPCTHTRDVTVTCALPGYEGCFSNRPVDWQSSSSIQTSLTIERCLSVCRRNYQVAALYGGSGCLCGNTEGYKGVQQDNMLCNEPCAGETVTQRCGGAGQITSYYDVTLGAPGYQVDSDKGTLTSPNFPGVYTQGISSSWLFTFSQLSLARVWFSLFDIRGIDFLALSSEVSGDIVLYRDGDTPTMWLSKATGRLHVTFSTNYLQAPANGFIVHYEATTIPSTLPTTDMLTTTSILTTTQELTTIAITTDITTTATTAPAPTTALESTTTPRQTDASTTLKPTTQAPTARATESTEGSSTALRTTPPEPTFAGNEFCKEKHGSALIDRIDRDPDGDFLLINIGKPFTCNGFITRANHLSHSNVPFNISVWRQERQGEYYIVGRFSVPATPRGAISDVVLSTKDEWIPFRQGDYMGVSWYGTTPLVYSPGGTTNEATTWLRWRLQGQDAEDYDDMNMGEWVSGFSANANPLLRAYSLQVSLRDKVRCDVPYVEHGIIMPSDREHVFEGDILVVDCKPGYRPHFMVARCMESGVFDTEIECTGDVVRDSKGLNFTHIIIMVVAVSVFFIMVMVISCAIVCGGLCKGGHRTGDSSKASIPQVNLAASYMQSSPEKLDGHLIPIDDDAFSNMGTEGGIYNPGMESDIKKPLGEGVNDSRNDHYMMGDAVYDSGTHMNSPPYLSLDQESSFPPVDDDIPPRTSPHHAPNFDPESDVSSSFTKRHPPVIGSLTTSAVNSPHHHTSMSTIINPVASTPSSDTPSDNIFSTSMSSSRNYYPTGDNG